MAPNSILQVTVFRIMNLLEDLPKQTAVHLADGIFDNSVEASKLVDGLSAFKEFACVNIDMSPREKCARLSKQYDFRRRVKNATLQIQMQKSSLTRDRLEFKEHEAKTIAEIKVHRPMKPPPVRVSTSEERVVRERESKIESVLAEMTLFEEMSRRTKSISVSCQKDFKALRLNAEKRCLAAIKKYDCLVGARHRLLEELTTEKNALRKGQEYEEHRARVQGILYAQLKEEREIGIMAAFMKKLDNFSRNRAAKIVQRAWRAYYERACAKRRRRTKKK